ncbi:MAG TPA: electron transfer flavoprotein subunit beta/FixA family protein [Nitrospiria bacterium]|nr:electron transfer flavoprotein subunit beta/FixA family protein [Nitrospiria bacterium]
MIIVVCIKQVPATESRIRIDKDGMDIDRSDLSYVVNPYDEFGVEEALRIKERLGGEVWVVTLGPPKAAEALRTCLAMGADQAIHIKTEGFTGIDSLYTAMALAEVLKGTPCDIIFFGKQAVDDDNASVGIQVGEFLNLPHVAVINKLEIDISRKIAVAHRQIEGGLEVVETPLPAIFTCQKGLNEPRYASLPGIMKAKQKPMKEIGIGELKGLDASPALTIRSMSLPPKRESGRIIEGEPREAVRELVRLLREEAKVGF